MKSLLIAALFMFSMSFAFAEEKEVKGADAQAVNAACTDDAKTAGCGDKKVGTGLMKCIHAYKKDHKDFKVSDGCKEAMQKLRKDHKEKKDAK